jgi:ParB-like chromosome segregation protein Spo0J
LLFLCFSSLPDGGFPSGSFLKAGTMPQKESASIIRENDIAELDPRMQRLMALCGITELPPVHTMMLPLDRIVVSDGFQVKPTARFVRNVDLLGIRQPPSVAFVDGSAWDAPDAHYQVLMGRRRIATARLLFQKKADARFTPLKCEVYEWCLPRLGALFGLSENDQRSASWVQEVLLLRELIQDGVAMTLDELASYGFHRRTIKKRLEMAFLPSVILEQICAGSVKHPVALQILRLKKEPLARLEALLEEGEALTAPLVKSLLKRQVDAGLATVHGRLDQYWTNLVTETLPPPSGQVSGEVSSVQVRDILRQFDACMQDDPTFERASLLIQVLLKELELAEGAVAAPAEEGVPVYA